MSWGGYIPGDLVNEIDWCKREGIMTDELFYKAAYLIQDHASFDDWEYKGVNRPRNVPGLGVVTVVEHVKDTAWDVVSYSYGEGPQGYEGEIALVFQIETPDGQTLYLKKRGTKDSYGTSRWDGKIVPVKPATKTVTTYVGA